jgi:hypothetical protein
MKHLGVKKIAHLTLVAGGLFTLLSACRPPDQGTNETMDLDLLTSGMKLDRGNFLKGGCGPKAALTQNAATELVRAKQSIPLGIQKLFLDWGVQISLSSDILSACKAQVQAAAKEANMTGSLATLEKSVSSCVLESPFGNGKTGYSIVIKDGPEAIHNWLLVTSFSLVYHIFDKFSADVSAQAVTAGAQYKALQVDRKALASAFIAEMLAKTETAPAITIFQKMFAQTSTANLAETSGFQSLVLSELSDAYYCSSDTWKPSSMPKTKEVFAQFAAKYLENK